MRNIEKLKQMYQPFWTDRSIANMIVEHKNYHFTFGEYTVSVIQEPHSTTERDLEYAIIYKGDLIFLEEEGDSVARYKTIEEVNEVLQHYKQKEEQGNE